MPLFDIANAHPTFQYPLSSLRVQIPTSHGKLSWSPVLFAFGNGKWIPYVRENSSERVKRMRFNVVGGVEFGRFRLLVKASSAATLEPKSLAPKRDNKWFGSKDLVMLESSNESSSEPCNEDSEEPEEREKLRRVRISNANKGNTPWNKGRKHSAETLRKIKERTRLAMQNPKVKMKLANLWHPQTTETRQKISTGVRMTWDKKRKKKALQEICFLEWQNLIAEASREGLVGQEELQWDSYETLDEQLKLEWSESVEQRKQMPRAPGSKRAPKTPEQRRRIAEAIYAKWTDPEYREKVRSGINKYHGIERTERKPRKRSSDGAQSTRKKPTTKKDTDTNINVKSGTDVVKTIKLKKSKSPYKDPLASSKLEMIKSIRAQRAVAETKQASAVEQARLLIAEAEKAAKALEVAAAKSPVAQASLLESRKLIAEAIQSLESIDTQGTITARHVPSVVQTETSTEKDSKFEVLNQSLMVPLNGHKTLLSPSDHHEFSDGIAELLPTPKLINGNSQPLHLTSLNGCAYHQRDIEQDQSSETQKVVTKKWIRGKLVEVVE